MRRILLFLMVAVLGAAVLPVVAQAGPASRPAEEEAELAPGVPALAAAAVAAGPDAPLDLLVTFDRPAPPALTRRLAGLGSWAWTAEHIPVGAVRIPAARLDALRRVAGVSGVYPDRPLRYFGAPGRGRRRSAPRRTGPFPCRCPARPRPVGSAPRCLSPTSTSPGRA